MMFLQFTDNLVPYDTFLNDVAARVVKMIKAGRDDPEYVSQRKAFAMFGRANVERWRRQGKIQPSKDRVRLNTVHPNCVIFRVFNRTTSVNESAWRHL